MFARVHRAKKPQIFTKLQDATMKFNRFFDLVRVSHEGPIQTLLRLSVFLDGKGCIRHVVHTFRFWPIHDSSRPQMNDSNIDVRDVFLDSVSSCCAISSRVSLEEYRNHCL